MKHFIELLLNHLDSLSLLVGIIFFFIRELYKLSIRKKELNSKPSTQTPSIPYQNSSTLFFHTRQQ